MSAVWNKLTTQLSTWFTDEKRANQLRPSCSLSMLNQKNLKVVRSSKSSENLHRINQNAQINGNEQNQSPSKKSSSGSSAAQFFNHFRKGRKTQRRSENETHKKSGSVTRRLIDSINNVDTSDSAKASNGSAFPNFPMSLSWHNHLSTASSSRTLPSEVLPSADLSGFASAAVFDSGTMPSGFGSKNGKSKPKRSRSISAMFQYAQPRSNAVNLPNGSAFRGFHTPQSTSAYKCKQVIDANFLSLTQKDQPVMNSDVMFRRLEKLGEGSYATVYKSENRFDGTIVALKEIKLQPQEGLPFTAIREVSLLRSLKHANIVRLHQIIHQPQALMLIFEYVKTDLSKFMENYKDGLDPFRTKVLLYQLLRGLAFCHERKILHRDLKPQNILVSEEGELKLADFGLARAKSVPCRTFSHDVVTLWYRPPDVLLGSTQYSTSLDMWGVGCIFGEICAGVPLFPGVSDAVDQLDRIFSIRGVPNPEKWPEVRELPSYHTFRFPPYPELPWDKVDVQLSRIPDSGVLLLSHFLQLNPSERISADTAMLHPYFSSFPPQIHLLKPTESVFSAFGKKRR
jgi:cyclin-dependent kinase 14